ncbi:MAG: hypothetical protein M3Z37_04340 [Candidatus Eremiobacteraeota bacterium]|nr:hypothetical protein [Candidatus Eremiobacteraeota bacterium]
MSWEALTAVATLGTFVVIATSAMAAIRQLRHMAASNQITASLALLDRWGSDAYASLIDYVSGGELEARLADPRFRRELMHAPVSRTNHPELTILGYWEQVGSLVKLGYMSEEAFMDIASIQALSAWHKLNPVIAIMRRRLGARMFNNFEFLVSRARLWQARHVAGVFPAGTPHVEPQDLWPEDKAWWSEGGGDTPAQAPHP